ncbi:MAG: sulfotransferase [Phycisphaerales bacterium]
MKALQVISSARAMAASGRAPEAERLLRAAVTNQAASVPIMQELASLLRQLGRAREAAELLSHAARLKPDSAPILVDLARALGESGQLGPAVSAAERATRIAPSDAQAWRELGVRLHATGRLADAAGALARAEALLPRDPEIKRLRAAGLHALGRIHEAIDPARAAVAIHQGPSELATLGQVLLVNGLVGEAMASFDRALALAPDHPEALSGKARAAESLGDRALAIQTLARVVSGPSCTNALLAQYAALCTRSPDRAAIIDLCRTRLRDFGGNPASTLQLHMALGALLEAEGDYAGAFESYRQGKACYPRTFNAPEHTRRMRELAEVFSADAMNTFPCSTCQDPRPVFIVGMPRSGTTLLEQIIAGHPSAAGIGEREELLAMIDQLPRRLGVSSPFPRCFDSATSAALDAIAAEYLAMLSRHAPRADRVADKMPHNFLALGVIALTFPRATMVHCRRHPLDTCFSCFATPLIVAHDYTASLANLVTAYRAYRELMAHWKSVLGDRLVEIEYEELIADPEGQSRRLIAATGLEWNNACLKFYEGRHSVITASASQVRRPMYDSSIGRWKKFEPYLSELIEGLKDYL